MNILEEALTITTTDRQQVYGPPSENFRVTSDIASAILGYHITPADCVKVALAMKLARLRNSPKHRDSMIDIAGYAWVLSEVVL